MKTIEEVLKKLDDIILWAKQTKVPSDILPAPTES